MFMKNFSKEIIVFFLPIVCCLLPAAVFSQDYPDAGSWNTFNVEKEINKQFTALFTEECRLKENFSRSLDRVA